MSDLNVETTEKELPLACEEARIVAIDADRRRVTHVISTGKLDRGNRMVEPAGWKLGNFKKAPRVLADHDYSIERVIGKAIDTKIEGDSLISTTEFDSEGLGAVAFRLVQNGLVNTWSVGWSGIKAHRIGEVDDCERCKAVKSKVEFGRHYIEQELLEYSLVAIPANPEAVMGLQKAGLVPTDAAAAWCEAFCEPEPMPPPARSAAFEIALSKLTRNESRRASLMQINRAFRDRKVG